MSRFLYENHRGSLTLTLLGVLTLLTLLGVLGVLKGRPGREMNLGHNSQKFGYELVIP